MLGDDGHGDGWFEERKRKEKRRKKKNSKGSEEWRVKSGERRE